MYTPQGAQLTGTNRPRTYHKPRQPSRVHYATSQRTNTHPPPPPPPHTKPNPTPGFPHNVTAATAKGKRPDPFRTRKLSPPAPMVLPPKEGGRVGHRRTPTT